MPRPACTARRPIVPLRALVALATITIGWLALEVPPAGAADYDLDCIVDDVGPGDERDTRTVQVPDGGLTIDVTSCVFYYASGSITPTGSGVYVGGDLVSFTVTGNASLHIYVAGTYGFQWTFEPATTPVTATVTVAAKTYDGSPAATINGCTLSGVSGGDAVSCAYGAASATFASAAPGTQAVSATGLSLTGADAASYTLDGSGSGSGTIDVAPVTATLSVDDRAYDGTTTATATGCSLTGAVGGDDVGCSTASADVSFADASPGTHAVSATGVVLTGADAGRYSFGGTATGSATISAGPLTAAVTVEQKAFDGGTGATIQSCQLGGVVPGDVVVCDSSAATATFADSGLGNHAVTATGLSLTGADAALYAFDGTATGTGTIAEAPITVTIDVADRTYDGTTSAAVEGCSVSGVIDGDDVGCAHDAADAEFASAAPGSWTVHATGLTLTGADAASYSFSGEADGTASIVEAPVAATVTVAQKRFDGRRAATITGCSLDGIVAGDDVTCDASSATATFAADSQGNQAVAATGIALTGADVDRYTFAGTGTGTGTILAPDAPAPTPRSNGQLPALDPGQADVTEDGQPVTITRSVNAGSIIVSGSSGFTMRLAPADPLEVAEPTFGPGGSFRASGTGFRPGTPVHVWVFSDPVYLGALTVTGDGSFNGTFQLPADLEAGSHTVQASGMPIAGGERVVNIGVDVVASAAPTPSTPPTLARTGGGTEGVGYGVLALLLGAVLVGASRLERPEAAVRDSSPTAADS